MKNLFQSRKFKNTVFVLFALTLVFSLVRVGVFKTQAAGSTISKSDGHDAGNPLVISGTSAPDTYTINYNTSVSTYAYYYTTGGTGYQGAGPYKTCQYNVGTQTLVKCNDTMVPPDKDLGGKAITTDGEYIYIKEEGASIVKLNQDLNFINRFSDSSLRGENMATDGEYLYVAYGDESDSFLSILNKDFTSFDFRHNQPINGTPAYDGKYIITFGTGTGPNKYFYRLDPGTFNQIGAPINSGYGTSRVGNVIATQEYILASFIYDPYGYGGEPKLCRWANDFSNPNPTADCITLPGNSGDFHHIQLGHYQGEDVIFHDEGEVYRVSNLSQLPINANFTQTTKGGIASLGNLRIVDTLPGQSEVTYSTSSPLVVPNGKVVTWQPTTNSGAVTVTINVASGICSTPQTLSNHVDLYAGVIKVIANDDTDTRVSCGGLSSSKMVRVIVNWKEGARDESVELKTLLKDVSN